MATIDIEKQVAIYREKEARLKRRIILCGGTGCVANGSLKVREALAKLLTEKMLMWNLISNMNPQKK